MLLKALKEFLPPSMSPNKTKRAKPLLGTVVEISLHSVHLGQEELSKVATDCFNRIKSIQERMSYFDKRSDIFLINSTPHDTEIVVDEETAYVIKLALELYKESNGQFDCLYKGRTQNPDSDIEFTSNRTLKKTKHTKVDLGGIAKGYAADEAAKVAKLIPEVSGVINAGGDIVFFGERSFPLSIRSPLQNGQYFEASYFSNCAVATSVFKERDQEYSISVMSDQCIVADPLTKALWNQNPETKNKLLAKYKSKFMKIDSLLNICDGELLH